MRYNEFIAEAMPDKNTLAKLKQDAKQLKAMSKAGDIDSNKAIPIMQNMAQTAASMDIGNTVLQFFEKLAGAIKKAIDANQYSPKDLPTMQKAYDDIMAQMPALKKMAVDSRRLAVQHGGAGRQDVGETTTAGSVATAAQPMGQMISRSMYNKDGTMKNGLDFQNVVGGPSKPKKAKKRRV